jgi:hypothetical protein
MTFDQMVQENVFAFAKWATWAIVALVMHCLCWRVVFGKAGDNDLGFLQREWRERVLARRKK